MISEPRVMIFPITMQCHSKCRSCGIWKLPRAQKDHAPPELFARVLSDTFLRRHVESVNISGGEPFAHPAVTELILGYLEAYDGLKEICINTDGHRLDDINAMLGAALDRFAATGRVLRMYISLDGIGASHDAHRRHPGAYANADRALRALAAMAADWPEVLVVTASFTISDENVDQIVPVFDYVRSIGTRVDYNLAARPEVFIGGAGLDRVFQVRPDQVGAVRAAIGDVCRYPEHNNFSSAYYATMLATLETGQRARGCFFPRQGFVLMPDGKVYVCGTYRDFYFGDLTADDFETLWHGTLRRSCADKFAGKCERCFANSYEEWDLTVGARA